MPATPIDPSTSVRVGSSVGWRVGAADGGIDGCRVVYSSATVGATDGTSVGATVGSSVGEGVGSSVGEGVGVDVGAVVGREEGCLVGSVVGVPVLGKAGALGGAIGEGVYAPLQS